MREYEKIAFADPTKDKDLKLADKLRALDQYRAIVERQTQRLADAAEAERREKLAEAERAAERERGAPLTVIYDYGDANANGREHGGEDGTEDQSAAD